MFVIYASVLECDACLPASISAMRFGLSRSQCLPSLHANIIEVVLAILALPLGRHLGSHYQDQVRRVVVVGGGRVRVVLLVGVGRSHCCLGWDANRKRTRRGLAFTRTPTPSTTSHRRTTRDSNSFLQPEHVIEMYGQPLNLPLFVST